MKNNEKYNDIILTSRIRLARNIEDYPFVNRLSREKSNEILELFKELTKKINLSDNSKLSFIDLDKMKRYEKLSLTEQHILSHEMLNEDISRGLILSENQKTSVFINEEDHLRIQRVENGLKLEECYKLANEIDDAIEKEVRYAYDEKLGYLTCCPTNLGTGMRASVMLHLPSLTASRQIEPLIRSLSAIGIVFRGLYGEGSDFLGDIFQISNRVTLGVNEKSTLELVNRIALDIAARETECREKIYKSDKYGTENKIMRSWGTFNNAVIMSSNEAMELISDIRLGISLGIIDNIDIQTLNTLMYDIMPASITRKFNINGTLERDIKRCEIIKSRLG